MALTAEKLAYFREYRKANPEAAKAAQKKWHGKHGADHYYENLELTRAIKRKSYYTSRGDLDGAAIEQRKIDEIRANQQPRKRAGTKVRLSREENAIRRKASARKVRHRGVQGLGPTVDAFIPPQKCEICGRGRRMCLDHCHKTNAFRGWLCDDCNIVLGRVEEKIEILEAMIEYLRKRSSS